ncbi:MAG: hypothetical protein JXR83_15480 [Deltaproteobacteria bacterium]|nr:hypothetical protein [Deltaproteobacteria bacterium]
MQRLKELIEMARERRIGFRIDEVMSGHHTFEPGCGPAGQLPMRFRVTWGHRHLAAFASPLSDDFGKADLEGTVSIDFLCREAPCQGTFELKYLSEQAIRYCFEFEANGTRYRYVGEKVNIWPWNLPVSHTTCFGTLVDAKNGQLVSRSVLHFRLATMIPFVASFRLA